MLREKKYTSHLKDYELFEPLWDLALPKNNFFPKDRQTIIVDKDTELKDEVVHELGRPTYKKDEPKRKPVSSNRDKRPVSIMVPQNRYSPSGEQKLPKNKDALKRLRFELPKSLERPPSRGSISQEELSSTSLRNAKVKPSESFYPFDNKPLKQSHPHPLVMEKLVPITSRHHTPLRKEHGYDPYTNYGKKLPEISNKPSVLLTNPGSSFIPPHPKIYHDIPSKGILKRKSPKYKAFQDKHQNVESISSLPLNESLPISALSFSADSFPKETPNHSFISVISLPNEPIVPAEEGSNNHFFSEESSVTFQKQNIHPPLEIKLKKVKPSLEKISKKAMGVEPNFELELSKDKDSHTSDPHKTKEDDSWSPIAPAPRRQPSIKKMETEPSKYSQDAASLKSKNEEPEGQEENFEWPEMSKEDIGGEDDQSITNPEEQNFDLPQSKVVRDSQRSAMSNPFAIENKVESAKEFVVQGDSWRQGSSKPHLHEAKMDNEQRDLPTSDKHVRKKELNPILKKNSNSFSGKNVQLEDKLRTQSNLKMEEQVPKSQAEIKPNSQKSSRKSTLKSQNSSIKATDWPESNEIILPDSHRTVLVETEKEKPKVKSKTTIPPLKDTTAPQAINQHASGSTKNEKNPIRNQLEQPHSKKDIQQERIPNEKAIPLAENYHQPSEIKKEIEKDKVEKIEPKLNSKKGSEKEVRPKEQIQTKPQDIIDLNKKSEPIPEEKIKPESQPKNSIKKKSEDKLLETKHPHEDSTIKQLKAKGNPPQLTHNNLPSDDHHPTSKKASIREIKEPSIIDTSKVEPQPVPDKVLKVGSDQIIEKKSSLKHVDDNNKKLVPQDNASKLNNKDKAPAGKEINVIHIVEPRVETKITFKVPQQRFLNPDLQKKESVHDILKEVEVIGPEVEHRNEVQEIEQEETFDEEEEFWDEEDFGDEEEVKQEIDDVRHGGSLGEEEDGNELEEAFGEEEEEFGEEEVTHEVHKPRHVKNSEEEAKEVRQEEAFEEEEENYEEMEDEDNKEKNDRSQGIHENEDINSSDFQEDKTGSQDHPSDKNSLLLKKEVENTQISKLPENTHDLTPELVGTAHPQIHFKKQEPFQEKLVVIPVNKISSPDNAENRTTKIKIENNKVVDKLHTDNFPELYKISPLEITSISERINYHVPHKNLKKAAVSEVKGKEDHNQLEVKGKAEEEKFKEPNETKPQISSAEMKVNEQPLVHSLQKEKKIEPTIENKHQQPLSIISHSKSQSEVPIKISISDTNREEEEEEKEGVGEEEVGEGKEPGEEGEEEACDEEPGEEAGEEGEEEAGEEGEEELEGWEEWTEDIIENEVNPEQENKEKSQNLKEISASTPKSNRTACTPIPIASLSMEFIIERSLFKPIIALDNPIKKSSSKTISTKKEHPIVVNIAVEKQENKLAKTAEHHATHSPPSLVGVLPDFEAKFEEITSMIKKIPARDMFVSFPLVITGKIESTFKLHKHFSFRPTFEESRLEIFYKHKSQHDLPPTIEPHPKEEIELSSTNLKSPPLVSTLDKEEKHISISKPEESHAEEKAGFSINNVKSTILTKDMMPSSKQLYSLSKEKHKIPKLIPIEPLWIDSFLEITFTDIWSIVGMDQSKRSIVVYDDKAVNSIKDLISAAFPKKTQEEKSTLKRDVFPSINNRRVSIAGATTAAASTRIDWTGDPGKRQVAVMPADYFLDSRSEAKGTQTLVTAETIKKTLQMADERYYGNYNPALNRKGSLTIDEKEKLDHFSEMREIAQEAAKKSNRARNYRVQEYRESDDSIKERLDQNRDAFVHLNLIDPKTGKKLKDKAKTEASELKDSEVNSGIGDNDLQDEINKQSQIIDASRTQGKNFQYCLNPRQAKLVLSDVQELLPPKLNRSFRNKYLMYKDFHEAPKIIQKVFVKVDDDTKPKASKSLNYGRNKNKEDPTTIDTFDLSRAKQVPQTTPPKKKRKWVSYYSKFKYPFLMKKIAEQILNEEKQKEEAKLKGRHCRAEPNSILSPRAKEEMEQEAKLKAKRKERVLTQEELHKIYETQMDAQKKENERNMRIQKISGAASKQVEVSKVQAMSIDADVKAKRLQNGYETMS